VGCRWAATDGRTSAKPTSRVSPSTWSVFVTADDKEQREQFILVNSTKPLPKGLVYELLPATEARLPTLLQRRRFPAYLLDRLNQDQDLSASRLDSHADGHDGTHQGQLVDQMLENSLSDGLLFRFRGEAGKTCRGYCER